MTSAQVVLTQQEEAKWLRATLLPPCAYGPALTHAPPGAHVPTRWVASVARRLAGLPGRTVATAARKLERPSDSVACCMLHVACAALSAEVNRLERQLLLHRDETDSLQSAALLRGREGPRGIGTHSGAAAARLFQQQHRVLSGLT